MGLEKQVQENSNAIIALINQAKNIGGLPKIAQLINLTDEVILRVTATGQTVSVTVEQLIEAGVNIPGTVVDGSPALDNIVYGENLQVGDLVYLNANGKYYKASNTNESTSTTELRLIIDAGVTDDEKLALAKGQFVGTGFTAGIEYVGVNGTITNSRPINENSVVRIVSCAINSTTRYFDPSKNWMNGTGSRLNGISIQGAGNNFLDNVFTISNYIDQTKKIKFSASDIDSGKSITAKLQNRNGVIAYLDDLVANGIITEEGLQTLLDNYVDKISNEEISGIKQFNDNILFGKKIVDKDCIVINKDNNDYINYGDIRPQPNENLYVKFKFKTTDVNLGNNAVFLSRYTQGYTYGSGGFLIQYYSNSVQVFWGSYYIARVPFTFQSNTIYEISVEHIGNDNSSASITINDTKHIAEYIVVPNILIDYDDIMFTSVSIDHLSSGYYATKQDVRASYYLLEMEFNIGSVYRKFLINEKSGATITSTTSETASILSETSSITGWDIVQIYSYLFSININSGDFTVNGENGLLAFKSDINYNSITLEDINTLAKLNNILKDSNLIDENDTRLSDSRPPTSHSHTSEDIGDFQLAVSNNQDVIDNKQKETNATHTGEVTGSEELTIASNVVDVDNLASELKAEIPLGASTEINWSSGITFTKTLSAPWIMTFLNPIVGKTIMIVTTGDYSITFPTGVDVTEIVGYDGTKRNVFFITCVSTSIPLYSLTNRKYTI